MTHLIRKRQTRALFGYTDPAWLSLTNGRKLDDKAQVTLCRSGGPDLYDLKHRRERHGQLIKSWQHCLLGRETIGSDREASTTKFYCNFVVLVVTVATI